MPYAGLTQDAAFASAPLGRENDKVAVHVPATFDFAAPFVLCVFLHGRDGDGSFEDHIRTAIDQIAACATNAVLVAPRFGPDVAPGAFEDDAGFSSFVRELQTLLTKAGIDGVATARAPIVLAAFSGGWRPLNAVLNGLLARGDADPLAGRIAGILLLDSIYGPLSSAGVIAWQKQRRAQTALLSIYGRDTGHDAPASNRALIGALAATGPVLTPLAWSALKALAPGTVAFFEVSTPHLSIVRAGPPARPIAAFLDHMRDRIAAPPVA
jgi:hypothetical protein